MQRFQSLTEQEHLHEKILGMQPVRDLEKTTPFHHLPAFIFWELFQKYGKKNSLRKKQYTGPGVMFTLDPEKTQGIAGTFICYPTCKEKLSFSLEYFTSNDPDFSESSTVQYFPRFTLSTGYRSATGVGWQGLAHQKEHLTSGNYLTSVSVNLSPFESSIHFDDLAIPFFLAQVIKDHYVSRKDWIQSKEYQARLMKK